MNIPIRRACLKLLVALLALLAGSSGGAWAATPPWPDVSFTYIATRESLPKVLAGFGQTFGLHVQLSPSAQAHEAVVDGTMTLRTPTEFLNNLSAAYGLAWFYHSGTVHVSRSSENVTRTIPMTGDGAGAVKTALIELGVVDPKFGWGALLDRNLVLLSGPPAYVDLVASTMSQVPIPPPVQQLKVFRLQHAFVDDRTIQYRDKQIVTAGVATILRNLVSGEGGRSGTTTTTHLVDVAAPLRASPGLSPLAGTDAEADKPPPKRESPAPVARASGDGSDRGVIQADSRLNAIIVKDRPDRVAVYEQLIALLDTPSQLIEIEAMIVDVNTTKLTQLGIDWGIRSGQNSAGFGQPSTPPDATTINFVRGTGVNPTTVIPNVGDFLMARIKAMEGNGDARIVSRPSVLTLDNLGALIDLSETFYIQTTGERVATVVPITVGVTLRVTPHLIVQNGVKAVNLVVDIEDGAIQDTKIQNLPTVRRSTIGTQAVVGENASLLIGGFNSEQNVHQKDGVPVLGSVPLLGLLFSKTTTDVQKRERLFLITPKIVPSALSLAAKE